MKRIRDKYTATTKVKDKMARLNKNRNSDTKGIAVFAIAWYNVVE